MTAHLRSTAPRELEGRHAIVTGASSGLGADFARELGMRGAALTLVARREDRLRELEWELVSRYRVDVRILPQDLSRPGAADELYERVRELGLPVDILVNNAGFAQYGRTLDLPWERQREMIQLNVVALAELSRLFGADMVQRGQGHLLQVASLFSFQAGVDLAVYAATKAFVLSFGEALSAELRGTGVSCTVLAPGTTETEFFAVSGLGQGWYHRLTSMTSATVAGIGIRAMLARRTLKIPGLGNRLTIFGTRFAPRSAVVRLVHRLMETR